MDRPILFSAPMVRALLDGRKTQTRRILKPQPPSWIYPDERPGYSCMTPKGHIEFRGRYVDPDGVDHGPAAKFVKLPYAKGDRLWVKETWTHTGTGVWQTGDVHHARDGRVAYRATEDIPGAGWFPSIFMFRKFSRLTLVVTDVRVQRLSDCSEVDAIQEGVTLIEGSLEDPVDAYAVLWDNINGSGAWKANPWIVAVSFEVHRGNIDQLALTKPGAAA